MTLLKLIINFKDDNDFKDDEELISTLQRLVHDCTNACFVFNLTSNRH